MTPEIAELLAALCSIVESEFPEDDQRQEVAAKARALLAANAPKP